MRIPESDRSAVRTKTAGALVAVTVFVGLLSLGLQAGPPGSPAPIRPQECCGARDSGPAAVTGQVPPPLDLSATAYDKAGERALERVSPEDHDDLHNVYRLSQNIISGSEPEGENALIKIAAMGVKTILSVDGKVPDAETALRHGMRYVHVPIRYRGISSEELVQIAKTFRELPGPFYVHCFHGKHRGPAAAAVGRLVLDGAPRDQAIAEMRQWCGTAGDYEGLYRTIASGDIPSPEETAAYAWSFPAAFEFKGFRHSMIEVSRTHDNLKSLHKISWAVDPTHPDLDPVHEARQLAQSFEQIMALAAASDEPADFQGWLADAFESSRALHERLQSKDDHQSGGIAADRLAEIDRAYSAINASCKACHAAYRND